MGARRPLRDGPKVMPEWIGSFRTDTVASPLRAVRRVETTEEGRDPERFP